MKSGIEIPKSGSEEEKCPVDLDGVLKAHENRDTRCMTPKVVWAEHYYLCEEVVRLRKLLKKPEPMSFNTAPKDGRMFLGKLKEDVWRAGSRWVTVRYVNPDPLFHPSYCWSVLPHSEWNINPELYGDDAFTHWMPIIPIMIGDE